MGEVHVSRYPGLVAGKWSIREWSCLRSWVSPWDRLPMRVFNFSQEIIQERVRGN